MYKVHDNFSAKLIGAEGARLLREYGQGRPAGAGSAEEAPQTATRAEINSQV
ncbi:hypothetical protein BN000_02662 [Neobacillus massiliamazoniensis]|uniref:Uncharacterized protein n=1 Tax=Neobacillus massiliamazoniensis TaxID=1499688 RepID=A0A0U1NXG8_9BACI|nr:hypothetical protein BN000_02662 [Neobacillus massiliamazoniensis]